MSLPMSTLPIHATVRDLYLGQSERYFSESKEEVQEIQDMHPRHAANAANKLLRDASMWAREAGVVTQHPMLWMTTTKLFQALTWRAGI
jgi:hypothetical protein